MKPSRVLPAVLVASLIFAAPLHAQGYRIQLDSRIQTVAYRGVVLDSIAESATGSGPNGGLVTPAGYAVTCTAGGSCTFFRPGPKRTGGPLATTADFAVWNLGVSGLSVRGRARVGVDVGDSDVWPGTEPAAQLLEGFIEYTRRSATFQLGRLTEPSRFGYTGFDGARATGRLASGRLWATTFGGWGLDRGVALPLTSPALNPLDEFRPEERQVVFGGAVGWSIPFVSGSIRYERQVDAEIDALVSERLGTDIVIRMSRELSLTGGADYDLASGWIGSAEGMLGYAPADLPVLVSVGARRYRPHFELWTIWGAFSPVPYHAGFASVSVTPTRRIQLRARGEIFSYEDSEATSPLTSAEDGGWRVSLGGRYTHSRKLAADAEYHFDKGVGGRSLGIDASLSWSPIADLAVTGRVGHLKRALEFRFSDADVWTVGGSADWRVTRRFQTFIAVAYFEETRDREDAAGISWDQLRINAGVRVLFASGADRIGIPPAVLRIPEGGER